MMKNYCVRTHLNEFGMNMEPIEDSEGKQLYLVSIKTCQGPAVPVRISGCDPRGPCIDDIEEMLAELEFELWLSNIDELDL